MVSQLISISLLIVLGLSFVSEALVAEFHSHVEHSAHSQEASEGDCPDFDCHGVCHFGFCQMPLVSVVDVPILKFQKNQFSTRQIAVPAGPVISGPRKPPRLS